MLREVAPVALNTACPATCGRVEQKTPLPKSVTGAFHWGASTPLSIVPWRYSLYLISYQVNPDESINSVKLRCHIYAQQIVVYIFQQTQSSRNFELL